MRQRKAAPLRNPATRSALQRLAPATDAHVTDDSGGAQCEGHAPRPRQLSLVCIQHTGPSTALGGLHSHSTARVHTVTQGPQDVLPIHGQGSHCTKERGTGGNRGHREQHTASVAVMHKPRYTHPGPARELAASTAAEQGTSETKGRRGNR